MTDEFVFGLVDLYLGGVAHKTEGLGNVEQQVVDKIVEITGDVHDCKYKEKEDQTPSSCIAIRYLRSRNPNRWGKP